MTRNKDSSSYVFGMAAALCIACSVVVAGAAVSLRPMQDRNRLLDQRLNVLQVAGLYEPGMDVNAVFEKRIDARVISLETGEWVDGIDPVSYDMYKAAREPGTNIPLSSSEDIAGIGAIPKHAVVYLLLDKDGNVDKYVLPVSGYGLWSTLYGYIAVEDDANTIAGITFYDHAETPGLGGEVDNPQWREQWVGKKIYDDSGDPAFTLVKGGVDPERAGSEYKVDALSGATLTSNGVTNMMRFWFSERCYKRFFENTAQS